MKKFFTISAAALLLSSTAVMAQDAPDAAATGDVAEAGLPAAEGTDIPAPEADVTADTAVHAEGHAMGSPVDTTASAAPEASADATASAAPAEAMASSAFTETQINGYVSAAMGVQEMQADNTLDDAAKQERAAAILAEAGLDPSTFNAISDAVRTDPAVAEQVQLALANRRGSPGA